MSKQRHLIKRQLLEIHVASQREAQHFQARMGQLYRRQVIPLLDELCSELIPSDQLLRLDKLELDLGPIDAERFDELFMRKLKAQLRQELTAQIQQQRIAPRGRIPPTTRSHLELVTFFAQTGLLPWWADQSRPQPLQTAFEALLDGDPALLRPLLRRWQRQPEAVRRLIHHLPDLLLSRWLAALSLSASTAEQNAFPALLIEQLERTGHYHRPLRPAVWLSVLTQPGRAPLLASPSSPFWQEVLVRLALNLQTTYSQLVTQLYEAAVPHPPTSTFETTIENLYAKLPTAGAQSLPEASSFEASPPERPQPESHDREPEMTDILASEPLAPPSQQAEADQLKRPPTSEERQVGQALEEVLPAEEIEQLFHELHQPLEEIYINNAGLVILWPFLTRLFDRLALLKEKQFKDAAAQQLALVLLHYLATGRDEAVEYLLPLNKLLCGLPLSSLLTFDRPLTALEREECDNLLTAVVAQAPILRDMSIDGLRGSFLIRAGVLRSRDGAWLLQVEQETYDIVLDRFPWQWAWVKLPWMETPLRVEWQS